MFFLIGIALFGIGLLGEYIGRIYQQVRHRPRYLVEAVLEAAASEKPSDQNADEGTVVGQQHEPACLPHVSIAPRGRSLCADQTR